MIDWQRVALNIQQKMPLQQASQKLGRDKSWLSHMARGELTTEPKFSDGLKLLNFHLDLVGLDKHRNILL